MLRVARGGLRLATIHEEAPEGLVGDDGAPVAWGGASGSEGPPARRDAWSARRSAWSETWASQGAKRRARLQLAKRTDCDEEALALYDKDPDRQTMRE